MPRLLPILVLAACHGADTDRIDTDGPTDTSTGGALDAACAETDNALRVACTLDLDTAAEAVWTVKDGDTVVRTFTTPEGTHHALTLWGLHAETDYTWQVTAGGETGHGRFTTSILPSSLAGFTTSITGDATDLDAMLIAQMCGTTSLLMMVDPAGEVVWYEPAADDVGSMVAFSGYSWTDEGTILLSTSRTDIRELAPSGDVLLRVDDLPLPVHHDLHRGGDYVYSLNASDHEDKVVDGFYVIDRDGAVVGTWDLADYTTLTGATESGPSYWQNTFPGAEDWSHGNSIWSDGHTVVMSLRWQDAAIGIVGDPEDPAFGDILWRLTGTTNSVFTSDFSWTDGGKFDGQHHITPVDGGLTLFDNEAGTTSSRAVILDVHDDDHTVSTRQAWSLGRHCDVQGAAYTLDGGEMLATCATAGYVAEFVPDQADAIWTMTASCGGPTGAPTMARAIPVPMH
jgi:hypothetical protein